MTSHTIQDLMQAMRELGPDGGLEVTEAHVAQALRESGLGCDGLLRDDLLAICERTQELAQIDARRRECSRCGCSGVWVDTYEGEIVDGSERGAWAHGETHLLADAIGCLLCDDCTDEAAQIDARRSECSRCGCSGVRVDTDAGEIVVEGQVVATAYGETHLLDADGRLLCDDCAAERLERSAAAAALGRAGRGASKVRGDSDHYRAMRAARRTLYGYRNVAYYPGPSAQGYAVYYRTGKARDAALAELRDEAVEHGLARSAAAAGIYPVKLAIRHLSTDHLEDLDREGSVRVDGSPR